MRVEREEFLNHVAAERAGMRSVKKKGKILTLRKEKRKELNHPVKRYLRKGRKITVLPGCAVKPRPKRSTVESKRPRLATDHQVMTLVHWANDSKTKTPRRSYLAEITGIPLPRIRACLTPKRKCPLTTVEYQNILAVMDQIEELEKQNAVRIKQKEMAA